MTSAATTDIQPPLTAGTWTIDAAHTLVEFTVRHMTIASVRQVYDETIHEFRHHRSRLTVGQRLAQVVTGSLILGMEKMSKKPE